MLKLPHNCTHLTRRRQWHPTPVFLPGEFHGANTLFKEHKRRLCTWTSPDGQHQNQHRLIIFFAAKGGEALYSQQKQDWKLTGSDHELLVSKFRLKLKKVGKTTRPFRYDLNQIPYDYTVYVTNRFRD